MSIHWVGACGQRLGAEVVDSDRDQEHFPDSTFTNPAAETVQDNTWADLTIILMGWTLLLAYSINAKIYLQKNSMLKLYFSLLNINI